MKIVLGALLVGLFAFLGCASEEEKVTEVVVDTPPPAMPEPVAEKPAEPAPAPSANSMYVTTSLLNVRSGPGMSNGVVRTARFKEKVEVIETKGNWAKIAEGEFVAKFFLSDSEPSSPSDPVVSAPAEQAPTGGSDE